MKVGLVPQRMRILARPTPYIDDNTCMDQFVPGSVVEARTVYLLGARSPGYAIDRLQGQGVKLLGATAYPRARTNGRLKVGFGLLSTRLLVAPKMQSRYDPEQFQ